ncbi:DNA-binding response regulator [candidate division KSB1 bacterium 4572_119]|nr:MAG: DNA-binding response regulator [candidate division KSB1 bacterium 4572_119]
MAKNSYAGSKILLVEDEETLAVGLEYNLTEEGYHVVWAQDGRKALQLFKTAEFDLIILDIMLPYFDGFEVARQIRKNSPEIPILMLTARSHINDKVQGLAMGADDYMTKPFHLQELLLRVKGMLKRKMWYKQVSTDQPVYVFGENEINFENFQATAKGQAFQLTAHEAMVLKYLIQNKGKIVSRKELLEEVWNISSEIETRTVDNFIVRLRKYFEPDPAKPIYIKSVRSAGYMFTDAL